MLEQRIIDSESFQDDGKGKLCFGDPALCRQSKNEMITMMLKQKRGWKGRAEYPVDCTPMSVVGLMARVFTISGSEW